ncbi:putative cysteine-rich receptor-like protein kinase 43 isoform X2 [Cinnamomum micranthum f. kanehirae]|uniref:Putative cysteine-rich receptor-like protein kinase 43 isoform X2 n=1 Tax=Cinnamomum micranthum f. kanehirae TaxID=337451 RepID=A0A3S3P5U9_9MAGN|nr:putative cysteine-rich receptor-like protein kinase 43 isoform X2 [Cinnamomum micranthum f. kanehirae]
MAQCFGELLPDDCSDCHPAIGKHLHGCFPAIGGRVYLEGCFIRAENYSFFHEISTKEDKRVGYGFGLESSTNITLSASANCWKTLDNKSCSACLGDAAKDVSSCSPATEGRARLRRLLYPIFINYDLIINDTGTLADGREIAIKRLFVNATSQGSQVYEEVNMIKPSPTQKLGSAWKHFQSNTVSEIMDESLEVDDIGEVSRAAQVGLLCTQESLSQRPSMKETIQFLMEKGLQLPSPSRPSFVDEYIELSVASDTPSSLSTN